MPDAIINSNKRCIVRQVSEPILGKFDKNLKASPYLMTCRQKPGGVFSLINGTLFGIATDPRCAGYKLYILHYRVQIRLHPSYFINLLGGGGGGRSADNN